MYGPIGLLKFPMTAYLIIVKPHPVLQQPLITKETITALLYLYNFGILY